MAAEVEAATFPRRKTAQHRVATKCDEREEGVDTGSAKDIAIDFFGGVVSGISGIVVGQVCVRAAMSEITLGTIIVHLARA